MVGKNTKERMKSGSEREDRPSAALTEEEAFV